MVSGKHQVIAAGFRAFEATRLHRLLARWTGGQGVILTLHHVRPAQAEAFAPNRMLEVEPAFLDAALSRIGELGLELVSLDEAILRIGRPDARRFVAVTFDDGYRDLVEHALPILRRHGAPFAAFVTSGFADRTARLWWVELEAAVRALDSVSVPERNAVIECAEELGKTFAYDALYRSLRTASEPALLAAVADLAARAQLDSQALTRTLCLDWAGIKALAREPLCTIGAHTVTHPRLAKLDDAAARREMRDSRQRIEMEIGLPVRYLAYPIGDAASAGPRDYATARDLGFSAALTTRPGTLFPTHRDHLWSLPRVSLNGLWQSLDALEVMLTGAPFVAWNKGRRVVA